MNSMDFNKARFNMVEQQVRPWDVLDPRVLNVIGNIPREQFVPEQSRKLAYADTRIPIGHYEGRTSHMLNPVIEGRMLQSLAINEDGAAAPNTWAGITTHRQNTAATLGTLQFYNGAVLLGNTDLDDLIGHAYPNFIPTSADARNRCDRPGGRSRDRREVTRHGRIGAGGPQRFPIGVRVLGVEVRPDGCEHLIGHARAT